MIDPMKEHQITMKAELENHIKYRHVHQKANQRDLPINYIHVYQGPNYRDLPINYIHAHYRPNYRDLYTHQLHTCILETQLQGPTHQLHICILVLKVQVLVHTSTQSTVKQPRTKALFPKESLDSKILNRSSGYSLNGPCQHVAQIVQ